MRPMTRLMHVYTQRYSFEGDEIAGSCVQSEIAIRKIWRAVEDIECSAPREEIYLMPSDSGSLNGR